MEKTFGAWLKRQMVRREWNQTDLAERVGVSDASVSRWLADRVVPDPASCDAIAAALLIGVDDVLSAAGHRPKELRSNDVGDQLAAMIKRVKWDAGRRGTLEAIIRQWSEEDRRRAQRKE